MDNKKDTVKPSNRSEEYGKNDEKDESIPILKSSDNPKSKPTGYQHKKSLAQGMMDLALLSANAAQLCQITHSGFKDLDHNQLIALVLIVVSIIFQVLVGIGLILTSRSSSKNTNEKQETMTDYILIGVFIITFVNVISSAFIAGKAPCSKTNSTETSPVNSTGSQCMCAL